MTFGDIIEKFLGLFGVPPGNQRALSKRIKALKKKVIEMEEDRNDKNRVISAIGEKIADLKRELQVESNPQTQDLIMDRIEEAEKDLERKKELSRQMGENITAQRAMRARLEQLLEQLRHGADPAEIEILMERVVDMNEMREEAGTKVTELDAVGRKPRTAKRAKDEEAARAARRAAMLGTAAPAAAPAKPKPAAAAPAAPAPAEPAATPAPPETPAVAAG